MEKNKVTVKIEGLTSTGKSSITLAIINALKDYNIDVELDSLDHSNIEHLENSMLHDTDLKFRMDNISKKTKVVVKEIQLNS